MDMKSVLYGAHDFNQKHVAIQAGKTKSKHLLGAINVLSPQFQLKLKSVDKAIILLELLILNNIDAARALLWDIALQISKQQTKQKAGKADMGEQTLKEDERARLMGVETNYNAWTLLYVSVLSSLKNVLGIVFRIM